MKVLIINGSPRKNGNTGIALEQMEAVFAEEGIEVRACQVGKRSRTRLRGVQRLREARQVRLRRHRKRDGAALRGGRRPCGGLARVLRLGQRERGGPARPPVLQHALRQDHEGGRGRGVRAPRRAHGHVGRAEQVLRHLGMPIASGQYWNGIHGAAPGQATRTPRACSRCARLRATWRSS